MRLMRSRPRHADLVGAGVILVGVKAPATAGNSPGVWPNLYERFDNAEAYPAPLHPRELRR